MLRTPVQGQEKFMEEIKALKEDNKKLIKQVATLESKIEILERTERKNNIVIKGANLRTICKDDKNEIRTPNSNFNIRRMGPQRQTMKNKTKLRGKPIYIDDDLTPKDRKIQTTIRGIAKTEKQNGKTLKVGFRKVIINE
ncbi:hypothetical protein FQA39_LY13137 [Lamprigera yunnana]|nr:hypothetical protein FQA39_LY13137 [Lamprigera yunnana]